MYKHFVVHAIIYSYWNVWFMCPLAQFNQKYSLEYPVYTRYTFQRIRPCCRCEMIPNNPSSIHVVMLMWTRWETVLWGMGIGNQFCLLAQAPGIVFMAGLCACVCVRVSVCLCVNKWHHICDILTHKIHFELKICTTHEQNLKKFPE